MTALNTWPERTLDEVCLKITDGAHRSPKSVVDGLPMSSVKDLSRFGLNLDTARRIPPDEYHQLVRQGCQPLPGDVLIAKDGATALDTVCEIRKPVETVLLSSIAILRPDPTQVTTSFLRYFLDSPTTRAAMKAAFTTGAAIPRVVLKDFKRAPIRVPPLETQRRIASILSAYDDLIENNTRRIAILEEMARRIFEEWFVRFRFPGHEQVKMVESELGLIPEGWSVARVAAAVHRLPAGQTYKKENVTEKGRVMVVDQSTLDYLGFHDLDVDHPASVDEPRIIFGDHTCKLKLMLRPFSVGPNTIPLLGADGLDGIYVFQLVQGLVQTREYKRHWTDFSDKQVILCPKELASHYGNAVRSLLNLALVLGDKNRNLRATRDLLLPKLISGELDVSTLPEPEEAIAA